MEKVTKRIDCKLRINPQTLSGIKRKIRDDKTPLGLVKHLRNRLAHGTISFVECGDGITVDDLRELKDKTATYLREVVVQFEEYINGYQYLLPEKTTKFWGDRMIACVDLFCGVGGLTHG